MRLTGTVAGGEGGFSESKSLGPPLSFYEEDLVVENFKLLENEFEF